MKQKKNVFIVWFAVMLFSQGLIGADLFFPGGITPTFSARGANIIVDDDGQRDYASIQSAINNAVEGDVLYVHAGTYNEHIVVNKALTIIGNGSSDTIVSGGGTGDVLRVTASWVNITGLRLINSGSNSNDGGLELDSADHCRITYNSMTNNQQGIRLISADDNFIANNQADSNTLYGLYLSSSTNNTIDKNSFKSNNDDGIRLSGSQYNVISNNTCVSNMEKGIHLYPPESLYTVIKNNTISGNDYGIYMSSGENTVTGNTINSNTNYGVNIYAGDSNYIHHNNFIANNGTGVQVYDDGTGSGLNDTIGEGNYWSDYTGRYPGASYVVKVWNVPYGAWGGAANVDYYPLVRPLNLDEDNSPTTGTTGDPFVFDIWTSDIIDIGGVMISWSHGGKGGNNATVDDGDGTWSLTIFLDHSLADMTYTVQVNDTFGGNFRELPRKVTVTDNDIPGIVSDDSPVQGTTGDVYAFDLTPWDNIGVGSLNVSWQHVNLGGNLPLNNDGDGTWSQTVVLGHSMTPMTYSVQVNDSSGNLYRQATRTVVLTDNDNPTIEDDNSDQAGTTGDPFDFNISTSDNINTNSVYVNWVHGNRHGNFSLERDGDYWRGTIVLDHNIGDLNYIVCINDSSNNYDVGPLRNAPVTDNDRPEFGTLWNSELATGRSVLFSANITENIGFQDIAFNFSINGGPRVNWSVSNHTGSSWYLPIPIPENAFSIEYYYWVRDTSGNVNRTGNVQRSVADRDRPTLGLPFHKPGTTGDPMEFSINVDDNIAVSEVYLFYTVEEDSYNISVLHDVDTRWNVTIIAPENHTAFSYHFSAKDTSNNWNRTNTRNVLIVDNDAPYLIRDLTVGKPSTGDPFNIIAGAGDNIKIMEMWLVYNFDGISNTYVKMGLGADGTWSREIPVPDDALLLKYKFDMEDKAKNSYITNETSLNVLDNDPAEFTDETVGTPRTGEEFTVAVNVTDNVGPVSVILNYMHNENQFTSSMQRTRGNTWKLPIMVPVDSTYFQYSFLISDASNNNISSDNVSFQVHDNILPVAVAGPSIVIDQHENVTFDGTQTTDNIGIFRYEWSFFYDGSLVLRYGEEPVFTFDIVGIYSVTLNVTDLTGNWDRDGLTVTVLDVTPPVAEAGSDHLTEPGWKVVFDGRGSTDNIGISGYVWKFTHNDVPVVLEGAVATYTFYTPGDYPITLTVSDTSGYYDTDVILVTVVDNTPPTAHAGEDLSYPEGSLVTLTAAGSTDNVGIVNYSWKFLQSNQYRVLYGKQTNFTFNTPGRYNTTLTVRDGRGLIGIDHVIITILDITPPVVTVYVKGDYIEVGDQDQYNLLLPSTIELNASGSTDNVGIISYRWTVEYRGITVNNFGRTISYQFIDPGEHNVTLKLTDEAGNYGIRTFKVNVPLMPSAGGDPTETDAGFMSWVGDNGCLMLLVGAMILIFLLVITIFWTRSEKVKKVRKVKIRRKIRKRRVKKGQSEFDRLYSQDADLAKYALVEGLSENAVEEEYSPDFDYEEEDFVEQDMVEEDLAEPDMVEGVLALYEMPENGLTENGADLEEEGETVEPKMIFPDSEALQLAIAPTSAAPSLSPGLDVSVTVTETELKTYREIETLFDDVDLSSLKNELSKVPSESNGVEALGGRIIDIEEKQPQLPEARDTVDEDETEKKSCSNCGKRIDVFWAVCPGCKRPV